MLCYVNVNAFLNLVNYGTSMALRFVKMGVLTFVHVNQGSARLVGGGRRGAPFYTLPEHAQESLAQDIPFQ